MSTPTFVHSDVWDSYVCPRTRFLCTSRANQISLIGKFKVVFEYIEIHSSNKLKIFINIIDFDIQVETTRMDTIQCSTGKGSGGWLPAQSNGQPAPSHQAPPTQFICFNLIFNINNNRYSNQLNICLSV